MPLVIRKSVKVGPGTRVNIARTGLGLSQTVGRMTVNTDGWASFRIIPGFSWRFNTGKASGAMAGLMLIVLVPYVAWWMLKLTGNLLALLLVALLRTATWMVIKMRGLDKDEEETVDGRADSSGDFGNG